MLLLTIIFVGVLFNSCKKSGDTIADPLPDPNMITNSSFESNGNPSLQDWDVFRTQFVESVQDVPPGGGSWSVAIRDVNDWSAVAIHAKAAAPIGTHIYQFSFWSKCVVNITGEVAFLLHREDTLSYRKYLVIDKTTWTSYTLLDTLTTTTGDSLEIWLSGGYLGTGSGKTFYDLCRLEILN
jgi:hypothetical protein